MTATTEPSIEDDPVNNMGQPLTRLPFAMPADAWDDWFQVTTEFEDRPGYRFPVYAVGMVICHSTYKNGRRRGDCYCTFVDAAGHHVRAVWVAAMPS